ncbi:MAG: transposase family protein [Moraxellaceae bacterium]
MKVYFSIQELLSMQIQGMPNSRQAFEYRAKKEDWGFREVKSNGRNGSRREYLVPTEVAIAVHQQLLQQAADAAPALPVVIDQTQLPAVVAPSQLADWQRQCAEARLVLVREVQQRMKAGGKKTAALQSVVDDASAGVLAAHLQGFVSIANARAGDDRAISRRSLFEWVGLVEQAEQHKQSAVALLAPKPRAQKIPTWAGALLKVWGQPQKPNLTTVLDMLPQFLPAGVECPSYSQAYRFLSEKVGNVEREKGRMGSRSLKNIQPFIRRDTTILQPSDVYTADGHCFDAEVAHPSHGRPFRPEITAVVDVATRVMVGWSLDLAESGWAVLDAIRMSATHYGVPAVFYVDNGSGYKNDLMKNEGLGLLARLGTSSEHSLPYNSHARGIIERSHQSVWVKAAQNLPTYMGKDMDDQAKQQAFKVTRKQIKQFGQSNLMLQWSEFVQVAERVVAEYNNNRPRLHTPIPITLPASQTTVGSGHAGFALRFSSDGLAVLVAADTG